MEHVMKVGVFLTLVPLAAAYAGGAGLRTRAVHTSRISAAATSSATRFTNLLPATAEPPTLTAVQRARTIGAGEMRGVMATLVDQVPFAAPVDYVLNERGEPVFMLKKGTLTQSNAAASPSASLLVINEGIQQGVTLLGSIAPLPEQEFAQSHVDFLNVHPVARDCIASNGLAFYKMSVDKCYLQRVGTTAGEGSWLPMDEYASATIDALAPFAAAIIASVNGAKRADLRRFCTAYFGQPLSKCEMVGLDELGFDVDISPPKGEGGNKVRRRVGFSEPRRTEQEARSLFVKTFFQAWDPPAKPEAA
jgi:putative heme iron utilization protein